MKIQNIINFANETNIKFIYTGYNLIVNAPKGIVSQDFREILKSNKNELILFIENYCNRSSNLAKQSSICELSADDREFFEERAAIIEYDAEMPRQQAEELAIICLNRSKQLPIPHPITNNQQLE